MIAADAWQIAARVLLAAIAAIWVAVIAAAVYVTLTPGHEDHRDELKGGRRRWE